MTLIAALVATLVVIPVMIPATPVFVASVMPLVGSLPPSSAAIGIQATDGQAEYDRGDGQEEKMSFHVYSRVSTVGWHSRHLFEGTVCVCGTHGKVSIEQMPCDVAVFDPIVKLFLINHLNSPKRRRTAPVNHNGAMSLSF